MVRSFSRGYEIYYDGLNWRYIDDNTTILDSRPCACCGESPTIDGHDACLGYIYGATSACCGHKITRSFIIRDSLI